MFLNRKYVCLPMTRNFFNKNEESVEQDFKILVKYEKVSGWTINYEKNKEVIYREVMR